MCSSDLDVLALAVATSTSYLALGQTDKASAALANAPDIPIKEMAPQVAIALSKALYKTGANDKADAVIRQLVQNNPDDPDVLRATRAALAALGNGVDANSLVDDSLAEIIRTNDEGVRLAYAGQLEESIRKLTEAAERLPGNLLVVSNTALVLALALSKGTKTKDRMTACLKYRKIVAARNPRHPKLPQIDSLLAQAKVPLAA